MDQCVKTAGRAYCCSVLFHLASQVPRWVFLLCVQDDGTEAGAGAIKPQAITSGEEPGLMSGWLTKPLPVFPAMLDQSYQCFCSPAQRGQTRGSGTPSSLSQSWVS